MRLRFELIGPTRAAPHPPTPRRPDQKSLQAEATTCRNPGSVDCPGFFFVAVKAFFPATQTLPECVSSAATLLVYSHPGRQVDGTGDIVID